ncbi:RnaseH-domain-containing protein, partial [Mycena capillaripes]
DRGWIGVENREPLRALVAALKTREGRTSLKDERGKTEGRAGAAALARLDGRTATEVSPSLVINQHFNVKGAKLAKLTQKIAYAGIKKLKEEVSRKATDNNVKQITIATQKEYQHLPTVPEVWKSISSKDFSRQVRNFLWKSLHSAHRIGVFWKHIPECEERGTCQFCDEPEDLEHILLKCRRPGQDIIWNLAKELWLKKQPTWPELSLGNILGCGLATFNDEKGRPLTGTARLYKILISEKSIFAIWKIRNDCVLKKEGNPLHKNEIHNRWLHAINQRLYFDRNLANHAKYGKRYAVNPSLILQTWASTLPDEDKLPENWIYEPRVLVGTEPKTSHPPSQPVGQRGRNR